MEMSFSKLLALSSVFTTYRVQYNGTKVNSISHIYYIDIDIDFDYGWGDAYLRGKNGTVIG